MVTPHLLCMDETHVLPGIFLEIFKKMTPLLFFCSDPPQVIIIEFIVIIITDLGKAKHILAYHNLDPLEPNFQEIYTRLLCIV